MHCSLQSTRASFNWRHQRSSARLQIPRDKSSFSNKKQEILKILTRMKRETQSAKSVNRIAFPHKDSHIASGLRRREALLVIATPFNMSFGQLIVDSRLLDFSVTSNLASAYSGTFIQDLTAEFWFCDVRSSCHHCAWPVRTLRCEVLTTEPQWLGD